MLRLLPCRRALNANATSRRTKLIDDQKREVPRYRGLVHGTVSIIKEEGFRGIYRGLGPVVRFPAHPA